MPNWRKFASMTTVDILKIISLASRAGESILDIYHNESLFSNVEEKQDHSPLTLADKCSHEIIAEKLKSWYPDIPLISEEGELVPYEERMGWSRFWLVDPLDGTKEFLKRNGEFTVNIALIEDGKPVLGVIQVPVTGVVYYADHNGAYKHEPGKLPEKIKVNHSQKSLVAIGSRSHAGDKENVFLKQFDVTSSLIAGSSLKFCLVAEGKADVYYREGPTMEWDTAAGHVIVEAAGGLVKDLSYNKPDLRNGSFHCLGFVPPSVTDV